MVSPELHVVVNLDVERVTWAHRFIEAAAGAGIECSKVARPDCANVYLGDRIQSARQGLTVYFLAAFSAAPGESDDVAQRGLELANVRAADLTITVSEAETCRVRDFAPDARLYTGGFPVRPLASASASKSRTVCFVGDDRPVKGIEFEMRLIPELTALGYRTVHLSPRELPRRDRLRALGCEVYERPERERYWEILADATHYCGTSAYESLCVAGIEAALLGCACAAPDVGGYKDWCPQRYAPGVIEAALACVLGAKPLSTTVERYRPATFFSGLQRALG